MKTFILDWRIFDNEDDIFIFSRNVQNPAPTKIILKKPNQKLYTSLIVLIQLMRIYSIMRTNVLKIKNLMKEIKIQLKLDFIQLLSY